MEISYEANLRRNKEMYIMRRKDREMSKEFAMQIIDKSQYGLISLCDGDQPYGVPLSIVRYRQALYFHSGVDGRKVEILKENPKVSVAFIGDVKVPDNFTNEELDEIALDESKAMILISSVFTTEFESTIVIGKVKLVEDKEEKIKAMKLICKKYTPTKMKYFDLAISAGLNRTNVYKIEIEEITGKRKKYDAKGKEMKWARME